MHRGSAYPEDEEEVVFPACTTERDASDESVVETCNVDPEVVPAHTLSTGFITQTLYCIQALEGCPRHTKSEAEEEDHRYLSVGFCSALSDECAISIISKIGSIQGNENTEEGYDYRCSTEKLVAATPRQQSR